MSGRSIAASAPPKSAIVRSSPARGAYCVFLDGDCIVRPDFVATHRRLAEPGFFVTGNRALLSPADRGRARDGLEPEMWSGAWLGQRLRGGSTVWRRCCGCRSGRCASSRPRMGGAPFLQSRGLARRPRARRRLRCRFQRLGTEDSDLLVRCCARRAPQGRRIRHRRHPPVASASRSRAVGRQRCAAR